MPNDVPNEDDVNTNLNDMDVTSSGKNGLQKAKTTRKNYNKIIKILSLIVLIPITGMVLDYLLNEPDVVETRYALTENCWTDIMVRTETASIVRLVFDCNMDADVEEVRDAIGELREKANELDYNMSIPFTAEGLYHQFQNRIDVDGDKI